MITIIYQFKYNVMWHCRINYFFSFPEQLQIWIMRVFGWRPSIYYIRLVIMKQAFAI